MKDNVGYTPSLTLDASSLARIAYVDLTNGALKYSQRNNTWICQVIETNGCTNQNPSIAMDSSNNPVISYYDGVNKDLKLARWNGTDWLIEIVDSQGDVGQFSSLAINTTTGNRHISYCDATNGNLKYANWNGTTWNCTTIDSARNIAGYTSITLDNNGYPCICYTTVNSNANKINQASWSGSSWTLIQVTSGGNCSRPSISIGINGNPCMTYLSVDSCWGNIFFGAIMYTEKINSAWIQPTQIDIAQGQLSLTSCSVKGNASTGIVRASYCTNGFLYDALKSGSNWTITYVDRGCGLPSLCLEPSGLSRIAYMDSTNSSLKYCAPVNTVMQIMFVDTGLHNGSPSIAVRNDNVPCLSYIDTTQGSLSYAVRTQSGWRSELVDVVGDIGFTSLTFDSQNLPCIAYYDRNIHGDLKLARYNGSAWSKFIVDSAGDCGAFPSVKCDISTGTLWISYYDRTNGDLKCAEITGSNLIIRTADSIGNVGIASCLAIDPTNGYPRITYYDDSVFALKTAFWNGFNWNSQVIDSTVGNVSTGSTSLVFDRSNGNANVSFYSQSSLDLKYATLMNGTWNVQTIDSPGNVGLWSSMDLDSNGRPFIVYSDNTNGNLKYATFDGTNWKIDVIENVGNVGLMPSLKIDSLNNPHVAYQDGTLGLLRYASNPTTPDNSIPDVFVGVDAAFDNATELKHLVDQTKAFTNFFLLGCPLSPQNDNASRLNDECQDLFNQGMYFAVYSSGEVTPQWFVDGKQKWGNRLLGGYIGDEAGGRQIDAYIGRTVTSASDYADAGNQFVSNVGEDLNGVCGNTNLLKFSSDYALYWWDYKSGYDVVLTQFGWNISRQLDIAQVRGAAASQNKDWGAIITWEYTSPPYLEPGAAMLSDMIQAYVNGAKYITIFDSDTDYRHTTLKQEHLQALQQFWQYIKDHPRQTNLISNRVALVLPKDYAVGFRWQDERIWGLWNADPTSIQLYAQVQDALNQYGSSLDIVYSEKVITGYKELIYWDGTNPTTPSPPPFTPTPEPTLTPTPPTNTPEPTASPTSTPNPTVTPAPTLTPEPTPTPIIYITPTPTPTEIITPAPTLTPTLTPPLTLNPTVSDPITSPTLSNTPFESLASPSPSPTIPEFQTIAMLAIALIATLFVVAIKMKNHKR